MTMKKAAPPAAPKREDHARADLPVAHRGRMGPLDDDGRHRVMVGTRRVLASVRPAALAGRLREVLAVDASESLRGCPARLLYIGGRRDRLVPSRAIERIAALRPDVEVALLDAPHLVLQRKPAEAADLVASFLDRCS